MSVFNITGEEADPVKGFIFREVAESCKIKRQCSKEEKEAQMKQEREDRIMKNKAWRMKRKEQREVVKLDFKTAGVKDDQETESRNRKNCVIL